MNTSLSIYWRLLKYLKPHIVLFVVGILGFFLYAASEPALAKLAEYMVNAINGGASETGAPISISEQARITIPLLLMGIYVFRSIGSFLGEYCFSRVAFAIVHELRVELFNHLTKAPNCYFDHSNSGELMSRITFDVTQVTQAATNALKTLVREGATVIALLAYLLYEDWQVTLIFLAIVPVLGIIVSIVSKRMRKLSKRIQASMGDITHVCSEVINNLRVMRIFGGETFEKKRFKKASHNNYRQNLKLIATQAAGTPAIQMLVVIALGVLLYFVLTFTQATSAGEVVAFLTAAGLMPKPIRKLSNEISSVQKGIAAADSIFTQLDSSIEPDTGTHQASRVQGAIEFTNLSFAYDDDKVLHDINLSIKPGETIAFVGRSGSGKTTLVNLLPRFYHEYQGTITLDGVSLSDYSLASLREQMSLVNQQVTLFNASVAKNIAYGSAQSASDAEIMSAVVDAHAWEFIESLPEQLETLLGENGARLSGGQRQRIALARALLKNAPILILDEATSALDNESERHIQAALETAVKGRTTLIIAHRLSTIETADRIIVMDRGRIIEQGDHASLLAQKGYYASLHASGFDELTP